MADIGHMRAGKRSDNSFFDFKASGWEFVTSFSFCKKMRNNIDISFSVSISISQPIFIDIINNDDSSFVYIHLN